MVIRFLDIFIIFLDIDGVLVDWNTIASPEYKKAQDYFCPRCVEAFNLFAEIPNCKIVVSSAWRVGKTTEDLQKLFEKNSVTIPVIGRTPSASIKADRGEQILTWIEENNYSGDYLVIDDEMLDIERHIAKGKLVEIKDGLYSGGLNKEIVEDVLVKIRSVLGYAPPKRRNDMCAPQTMAAIETVVGELTRMRRSFTGRDVHNRMHSKYVRRDEDFSGCTEGPREISRDVRKLFNDKHPAFKGYGSAIVYHDNGPVLFFALPHHAKVQARKIESKLDSTD
jgi:hypothetical protein